MKKFLTAAVLVAMVASAAQAAPIVVSIPSNSSYTSPLSWETAITGPVSESGTFDYDGGTVSLSFTLGDGVEAQQKASGGGGIYNARIQLSADSPYEVAFGDLDPLKLYEFKLTTAGGSRDYTFEVITGTISGGTPALQTITTDGSDPDEGDFDPDFTVSWNITPNSNGEIIFQGAGDSGFKWNTLKGVQIDVVPEPATMSLLGLGGLVALRRRRRA